MSDHIRHLADVLAAADLWEPPRTLRRAEHLAPVGHVDTRVCQVMSGCLRAYLTEDATEHTVRFGYAGNLIASLDAFVTEQPSDVRWQALRRSEVRSVSKARFMAFVHETPERLRGWLAVVERLVCQQMERERDLLTTAPGERYRRVLARSPHLFQEAPHKYIASYLRMTPETLSRLRKS